MIRQALGFTVYMTFALLGIVVGAGIVGWGFWGHPLWVGILLVPVGIFAASLIIMTAWNVGNWIADDY